MSVCYDRPLSLGINNYASVCHDRRHGISEGDWWYSISERSELILYHHTVFILYYIYILYILYVFKAPPDNLYTIYTYCKSYLRDHYRFLSDLNMSLGDDRSLFLFESSRLTHSSAVLGSTLSLRFSS